MPKKPLSDEEPSVAINLRIPESLRERIEVCAKHDHRFLSQELRFLLEMALKTHEKTISEEDK